MRIKYLLGNIRYKISDKIRFIEEKNKRRKLNQMFQFKFHKNSKLNINEDLLDYNYELSNDIKDEYILKIYVKKLDNDNDYMDREIKDLKRLIDVIKNGKNIDISKHIMGVLSNLLCIIIFMIPIINNFFKEPLVMKLNSIIGKNLDSNYLNKALSIYEEYNCNMANLFRHFICVLFVYVIIMTILAFFAESRDATQVNTKLLFNEMCLDALLEIKNENIDNI